MAAESFQQIMPGVLRFDDRCNVYLVVRDDRCYAIDFGTGQWLAAVEELDLPPVTDVLITHHHAEQIAGLAGQGSRPFTVHAPHGEQQFMLPARVEACLRHRRKGGWPRSFSLLDGGVRGVKYDMIAWGDLMLNGARLRFVPTPGHSPHALSIVADVAGNQVVFCGDAARADATLHEPYHLEWDHWTGTGILAAWEGVKRLSAIDIDVLCPSHGPVATRRPNAMLGQLAARLLAWHETKGAISPGEPDRYVEPRIMDCGARAVVRGLYQFGTNGYLLLSGEGEAFVVDPAAADLDALDALLDELTRPKVTAATATHYHHDHTSGLLPIRERFGARICLHPRVAAPLREIGRIDAPYLPEQAIAPDEMLPVEGRWTWNEYRFDVAPFAGQTWWHGAIRVRVAGKYVAFTGDNFQPTSRWNGTGGYSSFNGSRFQEGFVDSARRLLDWKPDVIAAGHGTYFRFSPSQFRKIIRWAQQTEKTLAALCPDGDLERHYHLHPPPTAES